MLFATKPTALQAPRYQGQALYIDCRRNHSERSRRNSRIHHLPAISVTTRVTRHKDAEHIPKTAQIHQFYIITFAV